MSVVRARRLKSGFGLRAALRKGQLFALLDATGFEGLADDLQASGLDHCSLFLGDDAVMLREEAPWLVALPHDRIKEWGDILRRGRVSHAGLLCASTATLDEVRRHWKKWLSVRIPGEEALVLFRFFDARIALAFLGVVGPADAQAFFGPNNFLYALQGPALIELHPTLPVPPTRLGAGRAYTMTEVQMKAFTGVAAEAFYGRFRSYMRDVWPEETAALTDAALDAMAARAIATAQRLGLEPQPNVIVNFAVIEMVAPHVIADADFYIDQVKDRVAPTGYSNILLMVATSELPPERAEVVVARASYWTSYP